MPRTLPSPMVAAVTGKDLAAAILVDLTLRDTVEYIWSGIGTLNWNGHAYKGVGSLGDIGEVSEGTEVRAQGTSITLSGIDSTLLNESLSDIQLGAPVTIWLASLNMATAAVTAVARLYQGTVDKPLIPVGPDKISITLALENRMNNMQRASNRRWTASDQRYDYPDDIGLNWVETLEDAAFIWG